MFFFFFIIDAKTATIQIGQSLFLQVIIYQLVKLLIFLLELLEVFCYFPIAFSISDKLIQMDTFSSGWLLRAAEVNMSMKTALGFANKIKDVSSANEVGSKLQVLGGPFAQMMLSAQYFWLMNTSVLYGLM